MIEKRFKITKSELVEDGYVIDDTKKLYTFPIVVDKLRLIAYEKALNELFEENEVLRRHIERSMIDKIRVVDVLGCARDYQFYGNEDIVKAIDWIAEDLGVDLDD